MAKRKPIASEKKAVKCKYCKKPTDSFTAKINLGACRRPKCVLSSMVDHL